MTVQKMTLLPSRGNQTHIEFPQRQQIQEFSPLIYQELMISSLIIQTHLYEYWKS